MQFFISQFVTYKANIYIYQNCFHFWRVLNLYTKHLFLQIENTFYSELESMRVRHSPLICNSFSWNTKVSCTSCIGPTGALHFLLHTLLRHDTDINCGTLFVHIKEWISLKQSSLCVRPAYTNTVSIHKPSILILTKINYKQNI